MIRRLIVNADDFGLTPGVSPKSSALTISRRITVASPR